jgi:hypothetical protein
MFIASFVIRSARNLFDHLDTEPRLLLIEGDVHGGPMHAINGMLKKKYTYRYTTWGYDNDIIEAATTVDSEEIAAAIRSLVGDRYDVTVVNEDIKLTRKNTDK